ncbi:MAG: hypothetical protein IH989_01615, partial [Planctomycetes bacterium]|nr:hypothetical protein [Planctomycetota bacterium]
MDIDDIDGDGWDDGIPTRVALRSFDFSNTDTVGRELGPPANPSMPPQYVFGLERQPYITEVATAADGNIVESWAVELYNPYPDDLIYIPGVDEYVLMQFDPDGDVFEVPLQRSIPGEPDGMFTVFRTDSDRNFVGLVNVPGKSRVYDTTTDMRFENGWTLYLVRRVRLVGETNRTDIVVDQFAVDGQYIGLATLPSEITDASLTTYIFSQERFIPDPAPPPLPAKPQSRWTATVPDAIELPLGLQTLGKWSARTGTNPMPVEVNFANTGSFTQLDPADDPFNPVRGVAFPTTGSMLMLMRHANREFSDRSIATMQRGIGGLPDAPIVHETADLSFTTWLDQVRNVGPSPGIDVREREQIDNGRMPVFDPPVRECTVSRVRCRSKADCTGVDTCEQVAPAVHHADPGTAQKNVPGGTELLPWGQLLWDYFTVLPLSSQGPYPAWDGPDPPYTPAAADSIPRVDLDGLRVHGRININAAPWMVMGGLPLIPTRRIPEDFRSKIESVLATRRLEAGLLPIADTQAGQLAGDLAMAVVAYRDALEITFATGAGTVTTGDFGDDWRGWEKDSPLSRRGTGLLTIGELANIRHTGASDMLFRVDSGELDADEPDYVKAVALLVSLGDWVTVRSHVFTTYGTLRGEPDFDRFPDDTTTDEDEVDRADDVDKRAVRFQETVDRLPTLLGASKPARIGQRYVGPYIDVRND